MIILREGKNNQTNIGVFERSNIPTKIYLIPYGKQGIKEIKPKIVLENSISNSKFVAVTLYKQRNGDYKLKVKNTSVCFSKE